MAINPIEIKSSAEAQDFRPRTPETGPSSPEVRTAPEAAVAERGRSESAPAMPINGGSPAPSAAAAPASADEAHLKYQAIEKVLEEDMGEIFNNLTPAEQKIFKMKGEEAARNIFKLVYHESKIKVKKIIRTIRGWLKSVPGINKYFLEQEAKLKADKIVKLAEADKKVEF